MKAEFASIVLSVAGPVLSAAHDRVWFGFKSRLVYEARDGPSFPCKFTLLRITRLAGRLGCPLKYDYYYRYDICTLLYEFILHTSRLKMGEMVPVQVPKNLDCLGLIKLHSIDRNLLLC